MTNPASMVSSDESVRVRSVAELAQSDDAQTVRLLIGALNDKSWRVRQEAVKGLARCSGTEAVAAVLELMRDHHDNLSVLNSAIQVLTKAGVETLEPLTAFLADPDPALRTCAALTLGTQNDPRAASALIRALGDLDPNVRFHAIEALGNLKASEAVDALLIAAESRDFAVAPAALDALASIGDSRAARRILPLLDDELLRSSAVDALGRLGDVETVAPLVRLLNASTETISVVRALAKLYDRYEESSHRGGIIAGLVRETITEAGVQNLAAALDAAQSADLPAIALVLGWPENAATEEALTRMLSRPGGRREAALSLARKGPRVTTLLVQQLNTEDPETRQAVVLALGKIADSRAVPALLELLSPDQGLVIEAAGALAMTGDHRAYAPLLDLLGHNERAVRRAAVSALNSLGHPDLAGAMERLLCDPRPLVRESAVRIVGYGGLPPCVDRLMERCRDESEAVRRAAIESLPALEDDRVLPTLASALTDNAGDVRAAAARSLGLVEDPAVWPLLQKALADSGPWVRYYAARSAGRLKLVDALDALSRLAQADSAMQVRVAAVTALGELGDEAALPLLASLTDNSDPDLASAAIAALGARKH